MKVEIDINDEIADFLIIENLKQTIADFEDNLEERINGGGIPFFSTDPSKDVIELNLYLDAFKITLDYFGVPNENI